MFGFIAMLHYSILFLPLLLSILQIKVHGFGHFAHESFVELIAWSSLTNAFICSVTAIVFVFFAYECMRFCVGYNFNWCCKDRKNILEKQIMGAINSK